MHDTRTDGWPLKRINANKVGVDTLLYLHPPHHLQWPNLLHYKGEGNLQHNCIHYTQAPVALIAPSPVVRLTEPLEQSERHCMLLCSTLNTLTRM
jgi:hypothetical protein